MKRLLPDSLAGWGLLIVIAALILAEITTLVAIAQSRTALTRTKGLFQLAERVSTVSRFLSNSPAADRATLAPALGDSTLIIRVDGVPLASAADDETLLELQRVLQGRLGRFVSDIRVAHHQDDPIPVRADPAMPSQNAGPFERAMSSMSSEFAVGDAYVVSARLQDGSWINFVNTIAAPSNLWSLQTLGLTVGGILIVLMASTWALRQLTGPYAVLAGAAERFGVDLNSAPLSEAGPREVRLAVRAFNLMRDRLKRMVEDRDQMVAAVSHDLRTPVTRLRLRAESIDDPVQKQRMLSDLAEIETMTQSVLTFASGAARPEARQLLDLVSLLESLCADVAPVSLHLPPDLPGRVACWAEPVALRRCVANLIDNAVKYGRVASVSLAVAGDDIARITIDDNGPGISDADLEKVFRPFVRLEASRNRETGGTGLGLTIARSVARSHGGDVTLSNRPTGGVRAEIVLPLTVPARRPIAAPEFVPPRQAIPAAAEGV
jgi:signal transduction histidine kinase